MVDLSSENSLALDDVAPSIHALGLGAARGAVRRRWVKKEKDVWSATGRVSTVYECAGPVRIIYQPSVTRHGTIDYHHSVIHPGRGASSGARLGA